MKTVVIRSRKKIATDEVRGQANEGRRVDSSAEQAVEVLAVTYHSLCVAVATKHDGLFLATTATAASLPGDLSDLRRQRWGGRAPFRLNELRPVHKTSSCQGNHWEEEYETHTLCDGYCPDIVARATA